MKKITCLMLAVLLTVSLLLVSCSSDKADEKVKTNVMVLNGTTGFGIAQLMDKAEKGEASLDYSFSVETDASNITAALISGTVDIAALPTNAASVVYNKTNGGVKIVAVNTLGVLYLVADSSKESISSFDDLRGKTVYCPAQNPTFIMKYLCEKNGLTVGEDITIDNTYASPADLRTAAAAGQVALAVLPEPMVTIAKSENTSLSVALDMTKEWDKVSPKNSLVQGCIVVRSDYAVKNPDAVAAFMKEYKESVEFLQNNPADASVMIEKQKIFTKAAVAQKAIPGCNICYIDGADMKASMSQFIDIMFKVAPASVGGAVPGDDFYYVSGR